MNSFSLSLTLIDFKILSILSLVLSRERNSDFGETPRLSFAGDGLLAWSRTGGRPKSPSPHDEGLTPLSGWGELCGLC